MNTLPKYDFIYKPCQCHKCGRNWAVVERDYITGKYTVCCTTARAAQAKRCAAIFNRFDSENRETLTCNLIAA